ncbi:thioesterase family protein [Salegentibacter sp. F188]|uniref:Thioesterase family protein n=1 Tax=Autumnicola patrickiae TaxID=3075591 RepID=A0ABU3E3V6_9FLAO|nr:thioesterase family protein [Salegentibacter sp. F188]MDT0689937.1 thioesterase family protein [Salegentibacter sp. F188]
MDLRDYKLSLEIRIDWSDLDLYQHVNNVSFMRYLQSGRVNFWEATGIYENYNNSNRGTMLVSTHCNFKKSLYYPGKAIVKTRLGYIKNSSFSLNHLVLNEDGEICAEGEDVVVCYDFDENKTFRIPEELRAILKKF